MTVHQITAICQDIIYLRSVRQYGTGLHVKFTYQLSNIPTVHFEWLGCRFACLKLDSLYRTLREVVCLVDGTLDVLERVSEIHDSAGPLAEAQVLWLDDRFGEAVGCWSSIDTFHLVFHRWLVK